MLWKACLTAHYEAFARASRAIPFAALNCHLVAPCDRALDSLFEFLLTRCNGVAKPGCPNPRPQHGAVDTVHAAGAHTTAA